MESLSVCSFVCLSHPTGAFHIAQSWTLPVTFECLGFKCVRYHLSRTSPCGQPEGVELPAGHQYGA